MKKILLSLATMLCASAFASADEVTIDLNSNTGFTGDKNSYTASTNGFTLTIDKASATSDLVAPSEEARIYKGATFTVTGDNGQQITQIVIVSTGSKYCGISNASVGEGSWSGTTYTWTGDANSIVFDSSAAQTRAKSITITYTPGAGVVVDAPQFSVESGIYFEEQTVAITAGDGSTIYYTTDGATPTDDVNDGSSIQYTKPITISTTTTIKAIAFDADDHKSVITSATYTILEPLELLGEGSEANPFTVADVITINSSLGDNNSIYPDKYWIRGYIVGYIASGAELNPVFNVDAVDSASNIILGPTADCTDINLCVTVQLPKGDVRTGLNLKDNPANLGKEVDIYGNILKYFGVPGVKKTSDYKINSTDSAIAIENDANAPVEYFNLQGVRVDNPAKGLYIMRQGSKVVKVVK